MDKVGFKNRFGNKDGTLEQPDIEIPQQTAESTDKR